MEQKKKHETPKDPKHPDRDNPPVQPLGDINSPGADPTEPPPQDPPDDDVDGDINSPGKTGGGG